MLLFKQLFTFLKHDVTLIKLVSGLNQLFEWKWNVKNSTLPLLNGDPAAGARLGKYVFDWGDIFNLNKY